MTKTAILMFACGLVLIGSNASAQVFYQYPEAPVTPKGTITTGPYATIGEHKLFRGGGFIRVNATNFIDVGAELLVDTYDGHAGAGLGVDARLGIFNSYKAIPFDLSVGAGLGYTTRTDVGVIEVPIGIVGSSPFKSDAGNTLVPYLAVYLFITNTKIDLPAGRESSDTDVDVELRGGARYTLSAGPDLFLTFFVGREAQVQFGVAFWPMGRD